MLKILIKFFVVVLSILIVSKFVPGITVSGLYSAVMVALFLGFLNLTVRPILVFLTLPITFLTLGTFIFIINAGIFMFVGSVVKGFYVDGFLPAIVGSMAVSFISWFIQKII